MTFIQRFVVAVIFILIAPFSAHSTVVQGAIAGVIRASAGNTAVDYYGLFGPAGASLDGRPILVFYSYDTNNLSYYVPGYPANCPGYVCTAYGNVGRTLAPYQPNVISVTINGVSVTSVFPLLDGYYYPADVNYEQDYDDVYLKNSLDPQYSSLFQEDSGALPKITLIAATMPLSFGVAFSPFTTSPGGYVRLADGYPGFNVTELQFNNLTLCNTPCVAPVSITPVSLTTAALSNAIPGAAYSQTLSATGGVPPYTWSVLENTLPIGFTLDPTSGTLSATGQNERSNLYSFTAMVTDSLQQTAQRTLSLLVNCSASDTTDTDGDGLPDCWESYGVYTNGVAINLPGMEANPNHKDVFVYYDWLDDLDDPNPSLRHTHDPAGLLDPVVTSFSNSPIDLTTPFGSGITLHLVRGHGVDERNTNKDGTFLTTSGANCNALDWTPFNNVLSADSQGYEFAIFHYALFAHDLAANCYNTGIARLPTQGVGLIVSLGYPSSRPRASDRASATAGTFMHELGHNLGLHHGGIISGFLGYSPDDTVYKPNYLSVMNYWFQLDGLVKTFNGDLDTSIADIIDYSRPSLETGVVSLDEQHLNESLGIGPGAALVASGTVYGTIWSCNGTGSLNETLDASKPVDWNCNGESMDYNVAQVLRSGPGNFDVKSPTNYRFLPAPESDWQHLVYNGGAIGASGVSASPFQSAMDDEAPTELSQSDALNLEKILPLQRCGADLNNDGVVDQKDLDFVKAHFGTHYGDANYDIRADYNGDSSIDVKDLAAVAQAQGCRSR